MQSALKEAREWASKYDILGRTFGDKIIPKQVFSWSNRAIALFINRMFAADGWYAGGNCNEAGIGQESVIILHQLKQLLTRFGVNSTYYPAIDTSIPKLRIYGGRDFEIFVDRIDIYKKKPRCPITKGFTRDRRKGSFKEINRVYEKEVVYDLRVPPHDNYVVDGVVVHNCGISQISGAYALHQAMFYPYQTILVVSKKEDDAKGFLKRNVGFLFSNLPDWMQELWAPIKWNEHEIEFPNSSSIKSLTSSPNVLRSHASSLNIIDEAAFIPSMDSMWASGWSCVVGDTFLSTDTGLIRINSLVKTQDKWQDIDINVNTDDKTQKSDKLYLSGLTPVRKIKTELGLDITATGTHRLRTVTPNGDYEWLYVNKACVGQYVVIKLGDMPKMQELDSELYMLGIILSRAVKVGDEIHTKFNSQLLTSEFVQACLAYFEDENGFVINKRQLRINNQKIFDLIIKYDIDITTPLIDRKLPNKILALGRDKYYHVVCGIIDAQSASGKRIGAIFDSHEMARNIQDILFDFGFPVSISETSTSQWRLIVIDSEIGNDFSNYFYSTRNDLRLCAESGQSLNTDHPIMVHMFEQECNVLIKENPTDTDINKCGSYGRIRFNDIQNMISYKIGDINSWLVSKNLFVDRIVSITEDTAETFDIQVPATNCYVSNSMISHNTLQHGGRVIVISTLNGIGDWYHKTLKGAEKKTNPFNLIEINWYDMDWVIRYKDKSTGEDLHIAPCEGIRKCSSVVEIEKYGEYWSPWLESQYIALAEEGETWKFDQEVLARVVSSGKTVVHGSGLDAVEQTVVPPIEIASGIRQYTHPIKRTPISLNFDFEGDYGLWFWEKPISRAPGHPEGYTYVLSVDTATGKGDDFNAIEIFCVETQEQVAEMVMRCIPKLLASYVDMLGRYYNNACVTVERNNGGDGVIDELRLEYGYPNLWRRVTHPDKVNSKTKIEPAGFYTNDLSKIALNKLLMNLVGMPQGIIIKSSRLHEQLCTYINIRDRSGRSTGRTGAENGCHDDTVMSLGIGLVALCSNPDPTKSIVLPFKIDLDFVITETIDPDVEQFDPQLIPPVNNYVDPENTGGDNLLMFTQSLYGIPKTPPIVVQRKIYYQ